MLAHANGELFEDLFLKTCKLQNIAVTRIPNGCRRINRTHMIPVKTPWDWVITYGSRTALIDTKCTLLGHFDCSKMKAHQIKELAMHERMGAVAGYLIWLRKVEKIFFMKASILTELTRGKVDHTHPQALLLGDHLSFDVKTLFAIS